MNGLIAWFTENRVAANLMMLLILVGGYLVIPKTQKEIFPNVALSVISITAGYSGASPEEVEEAVCNRLDRAISQVRGIDSFKSLSYSNFCQINATIGSGEDSDKILKKMETAVSSVRGFPTDIIGPNVKMLSLASNAGTIMISGNASPLALRQISDIVKNDLRDLGLTQVSGGRERKYKMTIEISEATLQSYNMNFGEIARVIRRNSSSISSGAVATEGGSISVETVSSTKTTKDFAELILRALPDGSHVTLGDIATFDDGFKEGNQATYSNGLPSLQLQIAQEDGLTLLEISAILNKYIRKSSHRFPEGITVKLSGDQAKIFNARIQMLVDNAISGLGLVFITLLLFLNTRLSFWVSIGIVVSFLGAFIILYLVGGSINMISTFAFLIVLGMVVDDAIIIGENIYKHQQTTPGLKGAIAGTQEMAKPVVFAVITTAVSFSPLLFLPGPDGKTISSIPIVVLATLLFSVIECLLILPAHLSHEAKNKVQKFNPLEKIQGYFQKMMNQLIDKAYQPALEFTLRWRYSALAFFLCLFFISVALIAGSWISVKLIADIEGGAAKVDVTFPVGSNKDDLNDATKQLEKHAVALKKELRKQYPDNPPINSITTRIGWHKENAASIILGLRSSQTRTISNEEIISMWQERAGPIQGASKVEFISSFKSNAGGGGGPVVNIQLSSRDTEKLVLAANALKEIMHTMPALYQITDTVSEGKPQIKLELKDSAYDLGLDLQTLAAQVRQAFHGIEVQSLQRSSHEVKVYLRYPKSERNSLWHLENMRIQLKDGSHVPLFTVANVFLGEGPAQITRENQKRIIAVKATVDKTISPMPKVWRQLRKSFINKLKTDFPGVKWEVAGKQKSEQEMEERLYLGFFIAVMVIYVLIATLFQSYLQPIIVLTAVPFGLVGAIFGHVLFDLDISMWSAAGMIAVSGIVVNDNMVLIFYINERCKEGMATVEAIRTAGANRFRPIILTSVTTTAGLTPMLLEKSFEAQFLVPMAIAISFGVMFATVISLFLIPALYLALEDFSNIKKYFNKRFNHSSDWNQTLVAVDDDAKLFDDDFAEDEQPQKD